MSTAYLLGAGVSMPAGYPPTSSLMDGVCYALTHHEECLRAAFPPCKPEEWSQEGGGRDAPQLKSTWGTRVIAYLDLAHGWSRKGILLRGNAWASQYLGASQRGKEGAAGPCIDVVLSGLDLLRMEGAYLSWRSRGESRSIARRRVLNARELDRVRERIIGALALAFMQLRRHIMNSAPGRPRNPLDVVAASLERQDTIVTSNWDGLADAALVREHDQAGPWYGTDALSVDPTGEREWQVSPSQAPHLLKLHGSLNWLYCRRCTRLYVNPRTDIAVIPSIEGWRSGPRGTCGCGMRLAPLLVVPSYVREYSNRHLANIWAQALRAFAGASRWVIAGYGMRPEDVHLSVMLMKALQMRSGCKPKIDVVNRRSEVLARVKALVGSQAEVEGHRGLTGLLRAAGSRRRSGVQLGRMSTQAARRQETGAAMHASIDRADSPCTDGTTWAKAPKPSKTPLAKMVWHTGQRKDQFGCTRDGGMKFHAGIDLKATSGTSCFAIEDATVTDVGSGTDLGKWVAIKFTKGNRTYGVAYCHLAKQSVKSGDVVTAGAKLGETGDTGNAAGSPHLHLEVHNGQWKTYANVVERAKVALDPSDYV